MNMQKSNHKHNRCPSVLALLGVIGALTLVTDNGIGPVASAQQDPLVYVPVASPCRIVRTQGTAQTHLTNGASRNFFSFGSAGTIGAQGGNAAGCDHPRSGEGIQPTAIAATVTAVGKQASGNGNIVAYPAGVAAPGASTVNYTQAANIANTTLIGLCTSSCPMDGDFTLSSSFADVPAIVDVVGYYYPTQVVVTGIYTGLAVTSQFECSDSANDAVFGADAVLDINNQTGNDFSGTFSLTSPSAPVVITATLNGTVYPFEQFEGTFTSETRVSGVLQTTSAGEFMGTVTRMSESVTLQAKGSVVTGETCDFLTSIYVDM